MNQLFCAVGFLLLFFVSPLAAGPRPQAGVAPTPAVSPAVTPVPVLIVTPAATATPLSPWPPEVVKVLATVGKLWDAFGLWLVLILLLAGAFAFARLVGKELVTTWAKALAVWLDDRRKNLAAKMRRGPTAEERTLLADIVDRYEHLEMKGFVREKVMTASLESIYVPLFAQQGGDGARLSRFGPMEGALARPEAGELAPLASLIPDHRCLVVLGEAGAGKSTFLRHVALTLARAVRERRPSLLREQLGWESDLVRLPILLPLGGFGLYLKGLDDARKESPNPELILGYMRHHFRDLSFPDRFFEERLKRESCCLVLLDGLDEVAHFEDRVLISQTITLLAQRYDCARFVVTCRPEGYRAGAQLGGEFFRADVEPLRWPEDITAFVTRWNQAVLKTASHASQDNTQDFLQRLEGQPQVRDLANNPLLLTVMIIVHFNVGRLPERRVDLYDAASELLLGWDTRWRRKLVAPPDWLDDMTPPTKRLYLEELAYHWQQQGTVEMRREEVELFLAPFFRTGGGEENVRLAAQRATTFLDWVVDRTYLLRPLGHELAFYRRAFQEYLAARRLAREPEAAQVAVTVLYKSWDWWEETVLLAVEHLSPSDPARAAAMIRALLDQPQDADAPHRFLVLASRALADAAREHLPWTLCEETVARLSVAIDGATPAFAVPLRVQAGGSLAVLGDSRRGVVDPFPLLVQVPGGPFAMGSSPEQVQHWKEWVWPKIEEGVYRAEGFSKEELRDVYFAWLDAEVGIHEVDLPSFYIARYPVTVAQFAPFVAGETEGYDDPSLWTEAGWAWRQGQGEGWGRPAEQRREPMYWRDSRYNCPNQPVVGITWFEAAAYARWLDRQLHASGGGFQVWRDGRVEPLVAPPGGWQVRLPSEAEWEKAARGTDGRTWPWGDTWDVGKANTGEDAGPWNTTPVGLYPEGASPYGVLDAAGNVWEWTSTRWGQDWRKPDYGYPYQAADGREDAAGLDRRVVRGGGWDGYRGFVRCAYRGGNGPGGWGGNVGFAPGGGPRAFWFLMF